MIRVMHDEPAFADLFLKFLLITACNQTDLVDQLFNSSEKAAGAHSSINDGIRQAR